MVGDRVAAVAADTREIAEAAARLVEVEYEDLPLVTLDNALDADAPILHPDIDTYKVLSDGSGRKTSHPNMHGYCLIQKSETGESLEDVFARADHVFEHTFSTAREFQGFLEPRACVVWIDETGPRAHHQHEQVAVGAASATGDRARLARVADRHRRDVHRRRFRRQGAVDRRVHVLLPRARHRPADQGGDELRRRIAGQQFAPLRRSCACAPRSAATASFWRTSRR